jgi:voltage-gated potassium channel
MSERDEAVKQKIDSGRLEMLRRLEDWLEMPMVVLAFVWLALLLVEVIWGLTPFLEKVGTAIWIVFIVDFALKLVLAPRKLAYLKKNWLTAIALFVPALRIFRAARALRVLRFARAARGIRLVRVLSSWNRGMRALGVSMGKRGFGYVVALTGLVVLAGAAGMYALEGDAPGGQGFPDFGAALWWTAMIVTTMGSEYWPKTAEGRLLCFALSLYAFAVFGYVTAALATFFVGRDVERDVKPPSPESIEALRAEIAALRADLRALSEGRASGLQKAPADSGEA